MKMNLQQKVQLDIYQQTGETVILFFQNNDDCLTYSVMQQCSIVRV